MKINSRIMKGGLIAVVTATVLFACKKESNSNSDEDMTTSLSTSATSSGDVYDDTYDVVMQTGEDNNLSGGRVAADGAKAEACATVTITPADTVTYPKTMVIDYGSGCVSSTGVTRKGKLTVTLSNKIRKTGTTISVVYDGYYVNGYKVEGTYSITNNSAQGSGLSFTTSATNGKVTFPNGQYFTHTGTKTFVQTAGIGTPTFADDSYSITGSFSNANSEGKSISGTIVTPLIKNMSCKNIVSGVIQFTYNGIKGILDFGAGTCDNSATLTVGLKTYPITLPR